MPLRSTRTKRSPPAICQNVLGCVLNGDRVAAGHDGARDREVGEQFRGARQHEFALALKNSERANRVAQVYRDFLANIALHAAPYQEQAGSGEAGCDQQHGEQEARAQARARHKRNARLSGARAGCGFRSGCQESQRTNLYPMPCTVRKCTGLDGSLSSFCRSLRMWLSTVRVEG